jgi:segregation and condensation protein A
MNLSIATHQAGAYLVTTPVYEGPLDLLLQLIERAELDITKLALAQVTDQYLEHLKNLPERAAEEVSAFLVIAAKLLQIKSEALLPRPVVREQGEEDPGEALAIQLIAYKKYRAIADLLGQREAAGLSMYLRLAAPPKVEGALDLAGLSLVDLASAAQDLLRPKDLRMPLATVVTPPKITIREKIQMISSFLRRRGRVRFREILGLRRSRLDIVVTFLALLELIKRHLVQASQEQLYGEIEIETANGWDENEEFELEFGE